MKKNLPRVILLRAKIVEARRRILEILEEAAKEGAVEEPHILKARIELLEAEIALEEAKK